MSTSHLPSPHVANGHSVLTPDASGRLWFNRLLNFRRKPKAAAEPSRASDYREQDATGYHPDGAYSHGKPTTGETACSVGGSGHVPAPAFGMLRDDIALLMLHARAAALCGETIESVKAYAASLFSSRYGAERVKFDQRVAAGRRDCEADEIRRGALLTELSARPAVVCDDRVKYTLPRDVRVLGLFFLVALWIAVLGAEWTNAASKLFDLLDSRALAYLATSLFVSLAVYVEWLLAGAITAASRPWLVAWRILSPLCALAYVALYAWRFGAGAGATELGSLGNLMDASQAAAVAPSLTIDRLLYLAQLGTGIVCGAALIQQIKHLLVGREAVMANPDRATLAADIAPLTHGINNALAPVAKAAGHLAEWQGCLNAFTELGLRAYRATLAERELLQHEQQLLQRERDLIDRRRQALLG